MSASPFVHLDAGARRFDDERGFLEVLYERADLVLKRSFTRAGVFRGLHWQRKPFAQVKLIRVTSGRILDFVADPQEPQPLVRCKTLRPEDGWILIEAHLAHGFYALEDSGFEYICHGAYAPDGEQAYSIAPLLREDLGLGAARLSAKDSAAEPLAGARLQRLD